MHDIKLTFDCAIEIYRVFCAIYKSASYCESFASHTYTPNMLCIIPFVGYIIVCN